MKLRVSSSPISLKSLKTPCDSSTIKQGLVLLFPVLSEPPSLGLPNELAEIHGLGELAELDSLRALYRSFVLRHERPSNTGKEILGYSPTNLLLSSCYLKAEAREAGSESAALLQWGARIAKCVVAENWQKVRLVCLSASENPKEANTLAGLDLEKLRLILEGFWFRSYRFEDLKQKPSQKLGKENQDLELELLSLEAASSNIEQAELEGLTAELEQLFAAQKQTLKLVLSPANICTPSYFSTLAQQECANIANVSTEVWNEQRLAKENMNLILAVGKGSPQESQLLMLNYHGAEDYDEHIALVGKGVCFDTGGTNLKSSAHIKGMQYDMMGAGIVYGAFRALALNRAKVNVRAYIPLVENQIGSAAIKTGDIVQAAMGQTVEINNTDAEGRLILADALFYAAQQKPHLIVDCATLTGAAIMALGEQCAAFYSNDERLAEQFQKSSNCVGEAVWRLPLFRPYAPMLKSKLADLSNISVKNIGGGSLTAALFLEHFALSKDKVSTEAQSETLNTVSDKADDKVGDKAEDKAERAWIHLDLAAWSSQDEHPSFGKNTHCMGVRLLYHFIKGLEL